MPAIESALAFGAAALLATGCGGAQKQANAEMQDFQCKDRVASYQATKHIGGDELGVQMDCAEAGPRIRRWRTDKEGNKVEDAHAMTPGEFDTVWQQVAGTGWENLKDCTEGGDEHDPIYVFDVKDDQSSASFSCQSRVQPFPYNAIADPLDRASQAGQGQLGDDEPGDLKALDRKQPK